MLEVLPSINVRTFAEIKERVKRVEPYVQWCHLDVTDGIFSSHKTWRDPTDLPLLDTKLNVEVHLMISEPEKAIEQWLVGPVKRVIVHLEAAKNFDLIIAKCREAGIEVGLAINPETEPEKAAPWLDKIDIVQVLAVHPGPSGQTPDWPAILGKIKYIRERCSGCMIEIDGGVNPETARQVRDAGANLLVSGNYIFGADNISKAIKNLL